MVSEGCGMLRQYTILCPPRGPNLAYVAKSKELVEASEQCDEYAQKDPCSEGWSLSVSTVDAII